MRFRIAPFLWWIIVISGPERRKNAVISNVSKVLVLVRSQREPCLKLVVNFIVLSNAAWENLVWPLHNVPCSEILRSVSIKLISSWSISLDCFQCICCDAYSANNECNIVQISTCHSWYFELIPQSLGLRLIRRVLLTLEFEHHGIKRKRVVWHATSRIIALFLLLAFFI